MQDKSLSYLLALTKPKEVVEVMRKYKRYPVFVKDTDGLAKSINAFINDIGMDGLSAMLEIHPHREMILENEEKLNPKTVKTFNATGESEKEQGTRNKEQEITHKQTPDYMPLLIAGFLASALFLSAAIIVKK